MFCISEKVKDFLAEKRTGRRRGNTLPLSGVETLTGVFDEDVLTEKRRPDARTAPDRRFFLTGGAIVFFVETPICHILRVSQSKTRQFHLQRLSLTPDNRRWRELTNISRFS